MNNNYILGLKAVDRARLLMKYSSEKTLKENLSELPVLNEQPTVNNQFKQDLERAKAEYQKSHPDEVWDPNITTDRQYWDSQGKIHTEKVKTGGWVPLTPENVGLRGTPFGFHPSEYPEYLRKVAEIKKKYPDEKGSWYDPTSWFDDDTDDIRNKELEKLKKEYYHHEFPYGITKEDYKDWYNTRAKLSSEQAQQFDKISKEFASKYKSPIDMPGSDYFLNLYNQNIKNIQMKQTADVASSFKNMNEYIDALFEYNPIAYKEINKGWLEKWWDDYGFVAEFLFWVVADIFSEGWLIPFTAARQLKNVEKLAFILKLAFRSGLPVAVGVGRSLKEGYITENAVLDFTFAILPWAHSYFSIAETPSVQLVESIVSKRKGLNLRNIEDTKKYIKTLTEEEKKLFKKVAKLSKNELESGLKKSLKEIDRIGKQVLKTTGKTIKPNRLKSVGKVLGKMAFIDLPAIEIANAIARKFGILDQQDKIKKLEEEFKNKQGTDLLILMANAVEIIKKYPNLSSDKTIQKINEKAFGKTFESALKILSDADLINALFVDEQGNPIK